MLSEQSVSKFQQLYRARFGKEISREEAQEKGLKLIRMIELVYRPMTEAEYERLQQRRRETDAARLGRAGRLDLLFGRGFRLHEQILS